MTWRLVCLLVVASLPVTFVLLPPGGVALAAAPTITEYPLSTSNSGPQGIAAGPDGNLWFTETGGNKIGKITPGGAITEYPLPPSNSGPFGIAAGPGGNLWFTESGGNRIGKITPTGAITEYPLPASNSNSGLTGIAAGPDGNLWFTEFNGNKIGKITPGGVITEYPLPTSSGQPGGIAAGPDGNLWFTDLDGNAIGKVTPTGAFTVYRLPASNIEPAGIAAGPDGNLWFTEPIGLGPKTTPSIGKITPSGAITEYPLPALIDEPSGIAAGPDGNLWFTESYNNTIGKITVSGTVTEYSLPTSNSGPQGIAAGPDGNLWFTESASNKIGRITSPVLIAPSPPTSPAPPAGACLPKSPPKVVVVMARGLTSSIADPTAGQAQDWYNPLSLDQCHASSSPNAALMGLGFNEFDQPALDGSQSLMAAIAATGALILPYSYNGAYFISNPAHKPEFHINAYSGFDTFNEIIASAQVLDYELTTIRQQWPTATIILIGHSEGGEVMKQWWRNWDGHHAPFPDHATSNWNVAGVYSLDSPINGGPGPETLCSYLQVLLPPSAGFCQGAVAVSLLGEYSDLWYGYALGLQDDTAMALSAVGDRAIYTPIGTRGDVVMEALSFTALPNPFNGGQELSPQLLAQFNSSGQIDTLIDPGRLTPTQAGSAFQGLPSHQVVYEDPQNIQFLASAVAQADAGPHLYVPVARFSPLLPPSPTARLQNPAALPGATITIQGQLLGTAIGSLALLSSPTQPPQPLAVATWSATAITASLPPGATSGMVVGQTAQGQPFFAGLLTVLTGSSSATHIQVDPVPSTEDGQPLTLTIHVTGSNGQPLANAPLTLSDGLVQSHAQSDAAGRAAFTLTGGGDQALVVFSGAAYAAVQIIRTPKPRLAITLSLSPAHPVPGALVVATATVRDSQGHPVSGVQVLFSALGPAQPTFAGSSALATNASGRASARLLPALPAQALVTASVPGSLASVGLVVDWQAASTTASVLPWWPLLPALLAALAAGFLFWRRRAKRPARA